MVATNGGTLQTPQLTSLTGVAMTLNGPTAIPVTQLDTLNASSITVTGGTVVFSGLTGGNANGTSFSVTAGTLSLPGLTSYTETTGATFQATGTGSVLDLPNVSIITGINSGSQHRFPIKTTSGGRINLPQVTQIVSPAGAGNGTGIDVSADGANSRIDLPAASPRSSTTI